MRIMRILSDVIVHLTDYWIFRRKCCLHPIRKENKCQKIENKRFCSCKTCSDSIQMIYVLFKYVLVLSTLLCTVRSNVAVMWLMVAISINFHCHICYILSWHLPGHAIMSVICFDLQFSLSTGPMTSFCIFITYINTEEILFNVKITRWD
jgi:hypothetical protein